MSDKCASKGKKSKKSLLFLPFIGFIWLGYILSHPTLPSEKKPLLFYTNRSDLKLTILHAIRRARSSITIQIYSLTDPQVINTLLQKQKKGLDVTIFYDKKASKHLPIPAYPVDTSALMHRKILIIDKKVTFIGTANFTTQSLKMHDNLIIGIYNPSLASFLQKSIDPWHRHQIARTSLTTFLLPEASKKALKTLIKHIENAKETINIAMFTLTHPIIIEKLLEAHNKGVTVQIAIDHCTANGASKRAIERLQQAGISILISQGMQLFHHKWALIDNKTFIVGSANWTRSAFSKNEDCLLILENLEAKDRKILQRTWRNIAFSCERT